MKHLLYDLVSHHKMNDKVISPSLTYMPDNVYTRSNHPAIDSSPHVLKTTTSVSSKKSGGKSRFIKISNTPVTVIDTVKVDVTHPFLMFHAYSIRSWGNSQRNNLLLGAIGSSSNKWTDALSRFKVVDNYRSPFPIIINAIMNSDLFMRLHPMFSNYSERLSLAKSFIVICYQESGLDPFSTNQQSGAYGLMQHLKINWDENVRVLSSSSVLRSHLSSPVYTNLLHNSGINRVDFMAPSRRFAHKLYSPLLVTSVTLTNYYTILSTLLKDFSFKPLYGWSPNYDKISSHPSWMMIKNKYPEVLSDFYTGLHFFTFLYNMNSHYMWHDKQVRPIAYPHRVKEDMMMMEADSDQSIQALDFIVMSALKIFRVMTSPNTPITSPVPYKYLRKKDGLTLSNPLVGDLVAGSELDLQIKTFKDFPNPSKPYSF